ncbi:MAG: hypothetical protein QMC80_07260 [Thermoplasmatales archaeon]|nr:hypothetical protein [Thermoplasmatales archaeon]
MNKKIMKAVLAIAVVFCFAAMPFGGIVIAHEAGGYVRNVAPSTNPADKTGIYALNVIETEADNSGSDTVTINCTAYDRNGDTDAEIDQENSWLSIKNATGVEVRNWTFTWNAAPTNQYVFNAGDAGDGLFYITDAVDDTPNIVYTVPSTYGTGTWTVNISIQDDDGLFDRQTDTFNVVAAIESLGIYNYTGLAVDTSSPFYWNFTANPDGTEGVAPGTLNVTSGNYTTYTYANDPTTNYGYDNGTARNYSYWLVVKNAGSKANQQFTLTFTENQFTSAISPAGFNTIDIDGRIDFEWYEGTAAPGGADDPNEHGAGTYIFNDADGVYQFTFTATNRWIWIRFMVDIVTVDGSDVVADANDYVCPFTVTAP